MQKPYKAKFIQLFLGLLLMLSTIWVIYDSINMSAVAASTHVTQPQEDTHTVYMPIIYTTAVVVTPANCRFGVAALNENDGVKLSDLGVGWYLTFGTTPLNTAPSNIEFTPMIRLKQVKDGDIYLDDYTVSPPLTDAGLGAKIDANLGATWIIGNEPDRGPAEGSSPQDDLQPDMYARAFHDVYEYIKNRDASAKVATAGLVEITPGRIQYLNMVSDAYYDAYNTSIPADIWTIHIYIMPEVTPEYVSTNLAAVAVGTDPNLGMRLSRGRSEAYLCGDVDNEVYCWADHDNISFYERQIRDMRTWMKVHGYQNKPLLITEYSILYGYETNDDGSCEYLQDEFGECFTPTRVSNYLRNTFDLTNGVEELTDMGIGYPQDEYRLVQQILWYPLYTQWVGGASNLYSTQALTETTMVGDAFRAETADRTPLPNLLAWDAASVSGFIIAPATTATVTLAVDIYNNGDTLITEPITITFYANNTLTDVIGWATIPNLVGCARGPVSVNIEWSGLTSGVHHYWVKADSDNVVIESSEDDNVTSGLVIIDPDQVFLPVITQ